ncbi:MAG TPA: SH3 domain-containing protein [Propionibacteriaceae bacterium]
MVGAVTTGIIVAASPNQTQVAYPAPAVSLPAAVAATPSTTRHDQVSRGLSSARPSISASPSASAAPKAKPSAKAAAKPVVKDPALKVTGSKYATSALNIRLDPAAKSDVVTTVKAGSKLSVTNAVRDGFRFVSYDGKGRWVTNKYLSDKKPTVATSGGISDAPCKLGSKVESGLTPDAIKVHRAICAKFPQVRAYGGVRSGGGNHGSGRAVDNMISDSTVGWEIARWVRANAKALGVSEVIYSRKIWTVQRGSEGWRGMSDRGSASANHYDHVHVSVYGNRATS